MGKTKTLYLTIANVPPSQSWGEKNYVDGKPEKCLLHPISSTFKLPTFNYESNISFNLSPLFPLANFHAG